MQRQAIQSAGELKHPSLLPKLVEKLGRPKHARYTIEAIVKYGAHAETQLALALASTFHIQKRIAIIKTLRNIRTPSSAYILSDYFHDSNDHIRAAVAKALANLRGNGVEVKIPRAEILQATLDEIKRTYSIHLIREDLGKQSGHMLGRALQDHLDFILDHLFSLLSLLYPEQDMYLIHNTLIKSNGSQKSHALELIDTMADNEIREVMLPLVEAPPDKISEIARNHFELEKSSVEERLNELTQSSDPILRAFAIYQLGVLGFKSLMEAIHQNMDFDHAFVQETVVWAITYASPKNEVQSLLEKQTKSKFETVRMYAERLLEEATR